MYDKYSEITIFEIENGWLLRTTHNIDTTKINNVEYTTTFYKDKKEIIKKLELEM